MISNRYLRSALIGALLLVGLGSASGSSSAETSVEYVEYVEIEGVIDPVTSRYLLRKIDEATKEHSRAIIVRLDTPGGLDISMREIVSKILNAEVPVVVWVGPSGARAASAGVFITYAAHVAAMAPGTSIGAAHPVNLGEQPDEVTSAKVTNDAVAYIRSIARQRGRNADWAEEAVRESASLEAQKALEQKVIDLIATAPTTDLLEGIQGATVEVAGEPMTIDTKGAQFRFHKMGLIERILHTAISPEVAYMLLLLGFYGLIFELYHPGVGAAGVLGGVSLILGFYALSVLPTSWAGVALLILSVAFFVADLHTAGLGVWTAGGTVALISGSLLLFSGGGELFSLSLWAIAGAVASSLLFFISIMTAAIKARLAKPISGSEGLVGTTGTARTDIAPDGQVMARGTLWKAKTVGVAIGQGSTVKILGVSGLVLMVEEAEPQGSA